MKVLCLAGTPGSYLPRATFVFSYPGPIVLVIGHEWRGTVVRVRRSNRFSHLDEQEKAWSVAFS